MKNRSSMVTLTVSALLCAVGIVIPMFSPLKIVLEPASFTLGSHVALFMAMFISLPVAVCVSLVTTLGFFLGGFPIVVVLRALSQIVFVVLGALYLDKKRDTLQHPVSCVIFGLIMAVIHAVMEVVVVTFFYTAGSNMSQLYYEQGYFLSVMVLVGFGTVVHSMVDYGIALVVWKPVQKMADYMPVNAKI